MIDRFLQVYRLFCIHFFIITALVAAGELKVTYIANEGFLLESGEGKGRRFLRCSFGGSQAEDAGGGASIR